jgi:hypothetical protein
VTIVAEWRAPDRASAAGGGFGEYGGAGIGVMPQRRESRGLEPRAGHIACRSSDAPPQGESWFEMPEVVLASEDRMIDGMIAEAAKPIR